MEENSESYRITVSVRDGRQSRLRCDKYHIMMCLGLTVGWHFPVLWVVVVGEEETRGINVGLTILAEKVGTEKDHCVASMSELQKLYIQVTSWWGF